MASTSSDTQNTVPSLPVENILFNVAHSVVKAQKELDEASLAMAAQIIEEELDTQYGLSAQWYTIPQLDFILKLAFEVASNGKLQSQMVDAEYQSKYGFNVKASSELKTKIMSVPPPGGDNLRLLTKNDVIAKTGQVKKIVLKYLESSTPHFVVRYHPFSTTGYTGGLWFVFLMDIGTEGERSVKALTVISDTSGEIVQIWTDDETIKTSVVLSNVTFTYQDGLKVLDLINNAEIGFLETGVSVHATAAATLEAGRPYFDINTLGTVEFLDEASLQNLKSYALTGSLV